MHDALVTTSDLYQEEARLQGAKRNGRPKAVARRATKRGGPDEKLPLFQYKEGEPLRELSNFFADGEGQLVEVRIPAEAMSSSNRQVRARQLWGNEVYTQDSDLVAVLMHTGFFSPAAGAALGGAGAGAEVRAVVQPLPPQTAYASCARNAIRSRAWGAAVDGCSFRVERCYMLAPGGIVMDLEPSPDGAAAVVPTFAPAAHERPLNTRGAASATERRQRTLQEVTVQYSLANEPWVKYSMGSVADRGLKPAQWTSARLLHQVLYLETHRARYELSHMEVLPPAAGQPMPAQGELYQWARCLAAAPLRHVRRMGVPLPDSAIHVLAPALAWEDIQWSPAGVSVAGTFYAIVRLLYTPRQPPQLPPDDRGAPHRPAGSASTPLT